MGQFFDGSARTTEAARLAIQRSQEGVRVLAARYGVSATTVRKWKKRGVVADARMGPKDSRSTVLSVEQEAACIALRLHTLLPQGDCLYALQPSIPILTRSSLHRLFRRHGISRLAHVRDKPARSEFKAYAIGYVHIDPRKDFGQGCAPRKVNFSCSFLRDLIDAFPYRLHTILTDNGIEHRLTKPNHPWTNAQVERVNRTIKDATVKRYHYANHDELRRRLQLFIDAYNHAGRLKTL